MTTRRFGPDGRGFGLIELLMSATLLLVVMAGVFGVLHPVEGAFRVVPESADVQQRFRVAADVFARELAGAGAGVDRGGNGASMGPLNDYFAPVVPFRIGRRNPDPPEIFTDHTITILGVANGAPATTIATPLAARSGTVQVNLDPGCAAADPSCGFRSGMDVLVFDDTGSRDTFSVTGVTGAALTLQHNMPDTAKTYAPGVARIVEATSRTFTTTFDRVNDMYQLIQYNGAGGADVPVVDSVAGITFTYLAEPQPPRMVKPPTDPTGPWTTYGPKPPPSGDSCLFVADAPLPSPRLAVLNGGAPGFVPLMAAELTDGPWCPDATDPNRFDADLFRIRAVDVTVRAEASARSLRGQDTSLFARPGSSPSPRAWVLDQSTTVRIAPRNLSLRR